MLSFRTLLRYGLISAVVGGLAYVGSLFLEKTFASSATLYFPASQARAAGGAELLLGGGGSAPDAGGVPLARGSFVSPLVGSGAQTATGILLSNTCLRAVMTELNLADRWETSESKALNRLRGSLDVKTDTKTGFLKINAAANDDKLAQQIIVKMLAHLDSRADELSLNVSRRNRQNLEKRVQNSEAEVERIKRKLDEELGRAELTDSTEFDKVMAEAATRYDQAAVELGVARKRYEAVKQLNALVLNPNAKYPQTITALNIVVASAQDATAQLSANASNIITELQSRRIELEDAARKYQPTAPEYAEAVKKMNSAEAVARQMIAGQAKESQAGLRPELIQAQVQIRALEITTQSYKSLLDRYEGMLRKAPARRSTGEILKNEFTTALTKLRNNEVELDFARLAEERDPARYEVVDEPMVEPDPVAPRKLMIAAIFAVLAFAVQIGPWLIRGESPAPKKTTSGNDSGPGDRDSAEPLPGSSP